MKIIRLNFVYSLSIEKFNKLHFMLVGIFFVEVIGVEKYSLLMARKIYKARKFQDNNLRSSCEGRHLYNKMCGVLWSAVQWCPPGQQSSGDPVLAMVISNLSIRIQQSHNTPTLDWNGDLSKVTDESFRLSIHKFIFDVFDSV